MKLITLLFLLILPFKFLDETAFHAVYVYGGSTDSKGTRYALREVLDHYIHFASRPQLFNLFYTVPVMLLPSMSQLKMQIFY